MTSFVHTYIGSQMITRVVVWTAVLSVVSTPISASAAPQDLFGFGARSAAMGMTGVAAAEDDEAVYSSPALLAASHAKTLKLGLMLSRHGLTANTSSVETSLPTDAMQQIHIGAVLPIPLGGYLRDRVAFGLGFLDPTKYLVRAKILYPERLQYPLLEPRIQSIAVMIGLGVRVTDQLYLGVGFEALAGLAGEIRIGLDATGRVGSSTNTQVVAGYAPIVSAAFDISSSTRVGIVYRGELVGRFAVTIKAQELGLNLPDFNVAGIAQYIPAQVGAEVRWKSNDSTVAVGVLYRRWSKWPGPSEPTVLENAAYGTGSLPIDAHDTLSPRVGAEHLLRLTRHADMRLRAGYAFEPSPIGAQTGKENLLDAARSVFTLGSGIFLDEKLPLSLETFVQLHTLHPRNNEKVESVSPGNPGAPSVTSAGTVWVFGLTVGVKF